MNDKKKGKKKRVDHIMLRIFKLHKTWKVDYDVERMGKVGTFEKLGDFLFPLI